jgi:hypothetical protein
MLLRSTTSTNIFSDAVFFSVLALGYIRTPLSMTVSMLTILTSSGLSSYPHRLPVVPMRSLLYSCCFTCVSLTAMLLGS